MRWVLVGACAALLGTAAVSGQTKGKPASSGDGVKTIASVGEIMTLLTIPLSNAVFEAGGEPPADDTSWDEVRGKAIALAEAGNLLMLGPRAKDRAAWMKFSRAQVDAAEAAAKAAAAKNAEQLSAASDELYETCASCHKVYMAQ